MKKAFYILFLLIAATTSAPSANAISFDLDSIAAWGKFPRFCVNTYRWGDKFFNGYDTTYVVGTGYKFNAKVTSDSWADGYRFVLPNNKIAFMNSDPSTSIGIHLSYLAVSAGYDINISKLLTGVDRSRQRFRFGFNCMLFAAEFYMMRNDVGTTLRKFGDKNNPERPNMAFNGINNHTWGIDVYYFFNHKRYSEAASFNFSRIQKRSQGSFYTGFSIYQQTLDFNFAELPPSYRDQLPEDWPDYRFLVDTQNYALRFGYGFNWVLKKGWVLGASESPIIGIRKGYVVGWDKKISLSLYNRLKMSVVWNYNRWFFGAVAKFDAAIINNKKTTYAGGILNGEMVFGYRFNLW